MEFQTIFHTTWCMSMDNTFGFYWNQFSIQYWWMQFSLHGFPFFSNISIELSKMVFLVSSMDYFHYQLELMRFQVSIKTLLCCIAYRTKKTIPLFAHFISHLQSIKLWFQIIVSIFIIPNTIWYTNLMKILLIIFLLQIIANWYQIISGLFFLYTNSYYYLRKSRMTILDGIYGYDLVKTEKD